MSAVIKDQKNKLSIPIYLDYSSTTPVDERVAKKMSECLTKEGTFGNPASRSHPYGWDSEKLIDEARVNVANLLGADKREIIWTSGATESIILQLRVPHTFIRKKVIIL
mgnify:CR=1 FL=1